MKEKKGIAEKTGEERTFEEAVIVDILRRMCERCKENQENGCNEEAKELWVQIDCLENYLLSDERITE